MCMADALRPSPTPATSPSPAGISSGCGIFLDVSQAYWHWWHPSVTYRCSWGSAEIWLCSGYGKPGTRERQQCSVQRQRDAGKGAVTGRAAARQPGVVPLPCLQLHPQLAADDPVLSGALQSGGAGQFMAPEGLLSHYHANILNSQGLATTK